MQQRIEEIKRLQANQENIRNICIIAHVDHGKTTLSDSLLASNGIISQRLAGKLRYLDSREDEQERGITMESSGISLYFSRLLQSLDKGQEKQEKKDYLINLIDSPGHVDFSCEVSSASRLCDGGLLLVDAVEGVCAQTHSVLRQAIREKVKPLLVLNKIDRLILEWKLTPEEAFDRLSQILEQVNVILGEFEAQEILLETEAEAEQPNGNQENADGEEEIKKDYYFAPEKGNVIFASAIDGWAFRTNDFASIYAAKMNMKDLSLNRFLWGKHYLDPKTKRVIGPKGLKGRNLKPMFVQFCLENIWRVYEATMIDYDVGKIEKIAASLGIKLSPRELKTKEVRTLLQTIFCQWLPLAKSILIAVVQKIPNPKEAQSYRMAPILVSGPNDPPERRAVDQAIISCDSSDSAPVIAFMSKIFSVSSKELPAHAQEEYRNNEAIQEMRSLAIARSKARATAREAGGLNQTDIVETGHVLEPISNVTEIISEKEKNEEVFIGFARIYSGKIKVGQSIKILGPKYNLAECGKNQYMIETVVERLFLLMGKELQDLETVSAGNVFGILCSDEHLFKSGTLSSTEYCASLAALRQDTPPILRVALEPSVPSQLQHLISGLKLLDRADPAVQVEFEDTGENVIICAGELHLERCLKDLKERYAKIGIEASEPLVPFRETLSNNPAIQISNQIVSGSEELPLGTVIKSVTGFNLRLRIVPIPSSLRLFILKHPVVCQTSKEASLYISDLKSVIRNDDELVNPAGLDWLTLIDKVAAFGAKNIGPNILIDSAPNLNLELWINSFSNATDGVKSSKFEYQSSVITGFQMATLSGPLCSEPMAGIAVLLEGFETSDIDQADLSYLPGQLLSQTKDAIKQGFLQYSPRLMLATYTCELQTEAQYLGKVDGVLSRRRGKILSEDIKDGSTLFTVEASLPVVESFGFVDELRKKTSGVASPQLVFNGFEVLDVDPFWVPSTEEELEVLGKIADRENIARVYMDKIRERKGLFVDRKVVEHGEKQKNLKNK